MEEVKESDIRVPLVFSIFCLSVIAGGVFLVIYVFFPALSQPWYPVAALVLIGSPWFFWFLTFLYTFMKGCCCRDSAASAAATGHQMSRRQTTRTGSSAHNSAKRVGSSKEPEMPLTYSA